VVAGEPVDACGGGSLFGGRDGSGRRIDGLHGGERQRKGRVAGLCGVVPSNEEQEGAASCVAADTRSGAGARGRAEGRRRRKREGKEQRKTKGKREKREKKLRKKEIGE
jgi:hypothetical protein